MSIDVLDPTAGSSRPAAPSPSSVRSSVPKHARKLVPLFIIWFGIGETSKISLIAIGVIFPLYINVFHAIRGVDERLVESANKAHWDDYTGYLAKIGGYPPAITKATTLQSQVPDQPFTVTGRKLLDGTKTFLLQQKLIATDFTIDSWVAPGAKT
jgi:hypothetical protein